MLIRSLADALWRDADFQASFRARWGRENCIIWGQSRRADFGPHTHTLSIRATWGGVEYCNFNGRTLAVDDDSFLILNHGRIYATSICATAPVESLAICFSPALVESMYEMAGTSIEAARLLGDSLPRSTTEFLEHLQPHDNTVTPVLCGIREHLKSESVDEVWLEEQLVLLLARMQAHHEQLQRRVDRLALVRLVTRREVYRRIALATDFLHTNYALPVDLATLASVCDFSKYHLLRLFRLVHGITPQAFLCRKRAAVAARLLSAGQMTASAVAARVGFSSEAMLLRQLRLSGKLTRGQLRAIVRGSLLAAHQG